METDDEELVPPTLSITLPPIPPPSRPPTKEDVDRAEYLKNMVQGTLSCLAGRSVVDLLVDLRNEMRAMREGFDRQYRELGGQYRELGGQYRELGGQYRELKNQSTMQLELTSRLVQSLFAGRADVVQSLREQVIVRVARNRELTESGQPAMEVVFLDGSTPTSQGLPPIRYYRDIPELNAQEARQYARGYGFGGTVAEIRNRLSVELGVLQAAEQGL
ncbi:hypothetical protein LIPSTDRAFT_136725 [Lipomyces starkeyi NRRL Y-11557]|uniref:Mug135-like C-terminal domain-containing protein n=1 Tax=Lipomyces starkeyi NRRL Y-11557 TaxID=675824 RepID=A0A1E3QFQ9_LIPST|nr:hypothetical protein LIPSTDRAFT_136725 [Lipomyces starkeyi NRRL Y-11557]